MSNSSVVSLSVLSDFYGPWWTKALTAASFVVTNTAGNAILLFIVWYVWSTSQERTRTLVTQLYAQVQIISADKKSSYHFFL